MPKHRHRLVLITGSRSFADLPEDKQIKVKRIISNRISEIPISSTVLQGGARGVDKWAREIAKRRGMTTITDYPDYEKSGRIAPLVRDRKMLDRGPDEVIAFWDGISSGTKYTTDEALKRGILVDTIEIRF